MGVEFFAHKPASIRFGLHRCDWSEMNTKSADSTQRYWKSKAVHWQLAASISAVTYLPGGGFGVGSSPTMADGVGACRYPPSRLMFGAPERD